MWERDILNVLLFLLFETDLKRNRDKIGNKWENSCIFGGKKDQKWEKLAFFPILQYDRKTRKTRGMINTGLMRNRNGHRNWQLQAVHKQIIWKPAPRTYGQPAEGPGHSGYFD
ncbi:hypothetical protein CBFG_02654 [Clostridiales bacterium 1_7_47FAA]|nr:hypothetical protein CBFG_02654 [Clostridiales bacterium 1_7_47FAA]